MRIFSDMIFLMCMQVCQSMHNNWEIKKIYASRQAKKQMTNELDAGTNFSSIRLDAICQALDSVIGGLPTHAQAFEKYKRMSG